MDTSKNDSTNPAAPYSNSHKSRNCKGLGTLGGLGEADFKGLRGVA